MKYIQFYGRSATNPNEIIEATGDRSVIIVDGRRSNDWVREIALYECRKRKYVAWGVFKGDTFTRSHKVSGPHYINEPNPIHDPFGLAYGVM